MQVQADAGDNQVGKDVARQECGDRGGKVGKIGHAAPEDDRIGIQQIDHAGECAGEPIFISPERGDRVLIALGRRAHDLGTGLRAVAQLSVVALEAGSGKKRPENEDLAQLTPTYLQRAGFNSFLARHDLQPGCDIWVEKIEPAITRAAGTVVIWSADTLRRPASVRREILLSQSKDVPLALFLSKGVKSPKEYPPTELEYSEYDPHFPRTYFADGVAAFANRLRKLGRCF